MSDLFHIRKLSADVLSSIQNGSSPQLSGFQDLCQLLHNEYKSNQLFRLRFLSAFKNGLINNNSEDLDFRPLQYLVYELSTLYERNWIFPQLFSFHVITNLQGARLIEIGGYSNSSITSLFGISTYVGTGLDNEVCKRESDNTSSTCHNFVVIDIKNSTSIEILRGALIFSLQHALNILIDLMLLCKIAIISWDLVATYMPI